MAPSQESLALAKLFETFKGNFSTTGNHFLDRAIYDQCFQVGSPAKDVSLEEVTVKAAEANLRGVWFKPKGTENSKHIMLFMHGGGFRTGSPMGHRYLTSHLAKASNCQAFSVEYRLAPEHKFPAAYDDCLAAYQYLVSLGFAPKNVVVAGDSCGGLLATSIPLMCVKHNITPPGASVSLSPWYDMTTSTGGSFDYNDGKDTLSQPGSIATMAETFVGGTKYRLDDPLLSPVYASAEDLQKIGPHWVSIAGFDTLRTGGEIVAENLKKAGVPTIVEVHDGQQHVMEFMTDMCPESAGSIERIGKWVQQTVGA